MLVSPFADPHSACKGGIATNHGSRDRDESQAQPYKAKAAKRGTNLVVRRSGGRIAGKQSAHGVVGWRIDPEAKTVEVFFLENEQYRLLGRFRSGQTAESRLLPGFKIAVDDLFASEEI